MRPEIFTLDNPESALQDRRIKSESGPMFNLKTHLQSVVAAKIPDAFIAKKSGNSETIPIGIAPVDSLIQGLPQGALTEIYGLVSSGRTTMAHAFMAEITHRQQVSAWIDVSDVLDPESLAAAGADLNRVLWVRCGSLNLGLGSFPTRVAAKASSNSWSGVSRRVPVSSASRHPRDEVRGMSQAIADLMGSARQPTEITLFSERRGPLGAPQKSENVGGTLRATTNRCGDPATRPSERASHFPAHFRNLNIWTRLEQALKVTDLLLHNGGFGAVVMDLGDIPPINARRIPLATWFRFRRAVENTPTIFLLLSSEPCAQTCASLVLHCQCRRKRWSQAADSNCSSKIGMLDGFDLNMEIVRQRTSSQNSHAATFVGWQTRTVWNGDPSFQPDDYGQEKHWDLRAENARQ
jgi:recombination protein RecA